MDDPFRELFNRQDYYMPDGSSINVTIYLKGGPIKNNGG